MSDHQLVSDLGMLLHQEVGVLAGLNCTFIVTAKELDHNEKLKVNAFLEENSRRTYRHYGLVRFL